MVVGTLIEAAADRDHAVCEVVTTSLRRIAKKHPSFVLKDTVAYRMRNPKVRNILVVLGHFVGNARSQAASELAF